MADEETSQQDKAPEAENGSSGEENKSPENEGTPSEPQN